MTALRIHWWFISLFGVMTACTAFAQQPHPHLAMRGIYGGVPAELVKGDARLTATGVNAIFIGSSGINAERIQWARSQGVKIFAEFNTMHVAAYVKEHPDAAPIGTDGHASPPPDGWQGVCPTHPGYRRNRMEAFRKLLAEHAIDGVWLDYHHAHASWERAEPLMPDTCFCPRCLEQFARETGTRLPQQPVPELSALLLSKHRAKWVRWRAGVFTDWVREFRGILNTTRPGALLGTFHNPWSDSDFNGARLEKLAIDLKAQAKYLDVFSPMPYHARFGHVSEPEWISRQVAWLGRYLGIRGRPEERLKIWPIVQLSDWGEPVPASQVATVLDHGSRLPATGVMVFAWGSLRKQSDKVDALVRFYKAAARQ